MNLFKNIHPENPFSDAGQSDRLDDIKAAFANGEISQEEYADLLADEQSTASWIQLKRGALIVLLLMVAGLFLLS